MESLFGLRRAVEVRVDIRTSCRVVGTLAVMVTVRVHAMRASRVCVWGCGLVRFGVNGAFKGTGK